MSRVLTFVGGVVSVGLAIATAGWESPPMAHTADTSRRGRLEFRHAPLAVPTIDVAGAGIPEVPDVVPTPPQPETAPATMEPAKPETTPEPAATAEPVIVEVTDVELCTVDEAVLPTFSMTSAVRIHIDPEGILYWVGKDKRTELNSQKTVRTNIDKYYDLPFVIVPDRWTNWLYVKDTLDSADAKGVLKVYLGGASKSDPTTLRVMQVYPTTSVDEAKEGDFVIGLTEGDGYAAQITIDGEPLETFPTDLALAWQDWRAEHGDPDTSTVAETPVVVEIHKFTPMKQVMPVLGVLRGLGVDAMRLVGDTGYAGRKRR